ncbi:MAG: hypothetical protein ABI557_08615, partial [Aureliella sp.]
MRMRHFMAACLASVAVSNSVPTSLSACEQCRGAQVCSTCQPSDGRGLLDMIDSVLLCRRPKLSPVSIPRLSALDGSLCRAVAGRGACRCGAGPDCGCELKEPTCGCELNEPNCGCEQHPAPPYQQLDDSYSESYSEPYLLKPPSSAENDGFQGEAPTSPPVAPLSPQVPKEIVPRPDREVDH